MAIRTEYAPGSFCWVDLATTDPDGAKRFYGELFGWEAEDLPAGPGSTYTMFHLGDSVVAAAAAQMDDERSLGIPPHWNSYISVESADATAARARELGADVHMEPFDVGDAGRMTILTDPQGAVVALWEARRRAGADLINAEGALVWNQLMTTDAAAAAAFYESLVGWGIETANGSTVIRVDGELYGGIDTIEPRDPMPPNWLVFFTVADAAVAVERVSALGGAVLQPPSRIGWGTIAVVADPAGAVFGLFAGDGDP